MKNFILLILITLLSISAKSQTSKIKVVFVSSMDTTFTLSQYSEEREININFEKDWVNNLKTNLDSSKYEVYFDTIPQNVKKIGPWTFWFKKSNSKIKDWLPMLEAKGYDILLFRYRTPLIDTPYMLLPMNYGYGLLIGENKVFSINGVKAYRISDFKSLGSMGLFHTGDFIKKIDKKHKIEKDINLVTENDLDGAIEGVKELDKNIVIGKICKEMNSLKFQEKFHKTK